VSPSVCGSLTHPKSFSTGAELASVVPLGERILSGRGPEFADLLETLGEAITIRDLNDRLVYANRAALRHLGFETVEEVQQKGLHSIMADYIVTDEHGAPVTMTNIPSVRLISGKAAEPLLIHTVDRQTGEVRWDLLKTAGLRDSEGTLTAAVTIIEDLTAVKTAEVHMRMLSEAGRVLASSLDLQRTLENMAHIAVPGLADWCVVDLVDQALTRDHVAVAHRDSSREALVGRLRDAEPDELDPDSILGRVILTGTPELFFDVSDQHLIGLARNDEHLRHLHSLELRSAIVVPMQVQQRTVGAMTFCTAESRRRLTIDDLDLAEQLASRAAIAVENSRLHTTLSRISETLQESLLPTELPAVPGWEIAALYRPAGAAQRIEVGGDFYEVFSSGSAALAVIGDVTGHGVTAATLTALMRHGARFVGRLEPQPAAILNRLDEALRQRSGTSLCTALCACLASGELVLSSAGHPPALFVDPAGNVTEAPAPGPLLGAFADAQWVEERVPVAPGGLVLLYTDGVTETVGTSERFGSERLRRLLSANVSASPSGFLELLDQELARFREGEAADDLAALALRPAGG
jgi:PAS domain S-box-containing protein